MRLTLGMVIALGSILCRTLPAQAQDYSQTYAFKNGNTGYSPAGLSVVGSTLYGVTQYGGAHYDGTVFSIDLATKAETLVYTFRGSDGAFPSGSLTQLGDLLYGTTAMGGNSNCSIYTCGTVYSLNPATGEETLVHQFQGGTDGDYPTGRLVPLNGLLYGTTLYGGVLNGSDNGTVFSVDPATRATKILHSFISTDGRTPDSLINVGNMLYGATTQGGAYGYGTLFSLDPVSGVFTLLYSFAGSADGAYPDSLIARGTALYGTSFYGGAPKCPYSNCGFGTVFAFDLTTATKRVLYAFNGGNDGAGPYGNLVLIGDTLLGETGYGGSTSNCLNGVNDGCGTVFSLNLATNAEQVLYSSQSGADGAFPTSLIQVGPALYGTTGEGGGSNKCDIDYVFGCGTVFRLGLQGRPKP